MIDEFRAYAYCCEDISKIENYEAAVSSPDKWVCHHRMETHRRNGKPRVTRLSQQDLIDWKLYFNRPASELVFMTRESQGKLHWVGRKFSEDSRRKMSESHKGKKNPHSLEWRRKVSEATKGKKHISEEQKNTLSKYWKGKHWKLVDGKRVWY